MNSVIKPYFEQLIEDREYTRCTGPAPKNVVEVYIEELECLLKDYFGDFQVIFEDDVLIIKLN